MSNQAWHDELEAFLKVSNEFALGKLETEARHPLTRDLASQARNDLGKAYETLIEVDRLALGRIEPRLESVAEMGACIHDCLKSGNRVFLCGCGATGRLSISLEVFCRSGLIPDEWKDSIIAFMAGGDAALIKSIEKFEDYPNYGARQLRELNFGPQDLLIASTEGGETPWVIGATEEAARISYRQPWFLYCNPDDLLCREVERSRRVINNQGIRKIDLSVGPMALSGSTRMQASTVLMLSIGWALQHGSDSIAIRNAYESFVVAMQSWPWENWQRFTELEADLYQRGGKTVYQTNDLGVTVLTDTTERSPTFTLPAYENKNQAGDESCLCYLAIEGTTSPENAWKHLLLRPPRCIEWKESKEKTGLSQLLGFDISEAGFPCQDQRIPFCINLNKQGIHCSFMEESMNYPANTLGLLELHSLLKIALNSHSTLIMGKLDRFESNIMTYVKPSNNKLIDRSARYIQELATYRGIPKPDYRTAVTLIISSKNTRDTNTSVVNFALNALLAKNS